MRAKTALAACLFLALVVPAGVPRIGAAATVADPLVTGPVTGGLHGYPLWDSWFSLAELGYAEAEYFISGTARNLDTGATSPYTTRIIVTRPSSPSRFNGSVMLDWVNVTAQFENAVDTITAHEFLLREGWAYVHVSAQQAGICCTPLTPKSWDPIRYRALKHPGDAYSFDMFSQIAKAVRSPAGVDPMAGLEVERVIAAGQSQSASRLYDYVVKAQAEAGMIDGFLIHGGGSKQYAAPPPVPVLHLLSDAEASPSEPNQTTNYRLWEVAGAAHSDFYIGYHQVVGMGPRFAGLPKKPASADAQMHKVAGNYGEQIHPLQAVCVVAGATFPMRYATDAALYRLDQWIRTGVAPPSGPRFQFTAAGQQAKDAAGNALGGIRLPPVDVPVARYASTVCALGGITIPFTDLQLRRLYPTHAIYYAKMVAATNAAIVAGWMLPPDGVDLLTRACAAKNRWLAPSNAC
ncbi:MAG: alpha/beta hydrolase domain-containing protein [Actinomycetota bacterium]